ncbi:MAG: Multidrug resistance transporter, Bcr/CflA family [uncultured Nocardioidaceae bacterium]|uniref:Multidrug resistance transporter, Bcr/CflA family n=1 Tax=uncultured Nocardioidaceae bacterium TaxID=253824 RepID=A0A6J4NH24_9ACTN|nr:MAG: Multidrug resistance transporter, Bcr/CflA family [uncultured Nocardioidaceae bacterium]
MTTTAPASSHTEPVAPTRPWRVVLLLGSLIALGPLSIDLYLPALPELTDDLSASPSSVQLTLTGVLVGLALGQLVLGPLSDIYGRRRPLLAGIAVNVVASLLCAVAPTILVLDVLRVLQGVGAAAASVVAMAVVRDLFSGRAAAAVISRLVMVMALAPVLAPSLGSAVLAFGTWRTVFLVLAGLGILIGLLAAVGLKETLPSERRSAPGLRSTLTSYGVLLRDPTLLGFMMVASLTMAAVFAYVSGASFVMQDGFGLDERTFGLLFGVGAVGLIAASQVNVSLLRRFTPGAILSAALTVAALAGAVLLLNAVTGAGGLAGILVPIWVILAMVALCGPNATALALAEHGHHAGAAAALLGAAQFTVGAAIAPLTGLGEAGSAVPMAATIAGALFLAAVLVRLVLRPAPAVATA